MRILLMALIAALCLGCVGNREVSMKTLFHKNDRILFQGDSITDGNRGRTEDPNHILGHGYAFIVAAKYGAEHPELNLTFLNRGISGNRITHLRDRWQQDTLDLKPTVLSILVGVNDAGSVVDRPDPVTVEQYEKIYDELLRQTMQACPGIRIVLCEPFVLNVGRAAQNWDAWKSEVQKRGQAVARLARKHQLPLVRFQKVFDEACQRAPAAYWMWDGIHPTYSGHQLMADEWCRTVEQACGK